MLFTAACTSTAGMLFQSNLAGYILQNLLSRHPLSQVLPAVAVNSQLLQIDLSVILSSYVLLCFKVRLSPNTVKKNVLIHWLLTLFKSAKKNRNTPYALCTHFTQAY